MLGWGSGPFDPGTRHSTDWHLKVRGRDLKVENAERRGFGGSYLNGERRGLGEERGEAVGAKEGAAALGTVEARRLAEGGTSE